MRRSSPREGWPRSLALGWRAPSDAQGSATCGGVGLGDRTERRDAPRRQRVELGKQWLVDLREVEARLALAAPCERRREAVCELGRRVDRHQIEADVALAQARPRNVAPRLALEARHLERHAGGPVLRDDEAVAMRPDDRLQALVDGAEILHAAVPSGSDTDARPRHTPTAAGFAISTR